MVHVTSSEIPEGAEGTVLQWYAPRGRWEVEYDNHPCQGKEVAGCLSQTSWLSRDTSIELTTAQALARTKELQNG